MARLSSAFALTLVPGSSRVPLALAVMPYGSTFNGIQNILSDEQVAAYVIGDELNDDNQNPVVYHRDEALITV